MEVKIGIVRSQEVSVDTETSAEDLEAAVSEALASGTPLTLRDKLGRTVMVPSDKIAYVDLAASKRGKVGFGA